MPYALRAPAATRSFSKRNNPTVTHLLYALKARITPEHIRSIAALLGENEGGISKAIGGLAPAILAGLLHKSDDEKAMTRIFDLLSGYGYGIPDDPVGLVSGSNLAHNDPKDAAGAWLGGVFGARVPAVTNALAAFSGVKAASVSSLLGLVAPLLMGLLHQKIQADKLTASGLTALLNSLQNNILAVLPTGLASIIGLNNIGVAAAPALPDASPGERWLGPLLLLLGLGGALMAGMKCCTVHDQRPAFSDYKPYLRPQPGISPD